MQNNREMEGTKVMWVPHGDGERNTLPQHYKPFNGGSFDISVASPSGESIGLFKKFNPVQENTQKDPLKAASDEVQVLQGTKGEKSVTNDHRARNEEFEKDLQLVKTESDKELVKRELSFELEIMKREIGILERDITIMKKDHDKELAAKENEIIERKHEKELLESEHKKQLVEYEKQLMEKKYEHDKKLVEKDSEIKEKEHEKDLIKNTHEKQLMENDRKLQDLKKALTEKENETKENELQVWVKLNQKWHH